VTGAYLPALAGSGAARLLADYDALLEDVQGTRLDVRAWGRFRRRLFAAVDAVVVPTERDRAILAEISAETEVVCIPFGADVDAPALDPAGRDDTTVLFVGNLNHEPNRDSATFLAHEVLPRIRLRHPEVVLRLVGERTEELGHVEGVVATGRVPDVAPYLDSAAVVVAPARLGAGMRVKVLDALVAGKALVASPLALEGLELEPGRHALVAGADEFAEAVSSLLEKPAQRAELGRNARAWAVAHLGWKRALDAYDALYARLVSRSGRERS
jgi:glycosyltransferase involved in cell wall biosynthesis